MSYTVIVCDMFHVGGEPDHEFEVPGFPTRDIAIDYARRRLRASLEEHREPGRSADALRSLWRTFGEDCRVAGTEGVVYRASAELEAFIRHPATPEECDYLSLYESLLPEDFALRCEWVAGAVPPPHHYEYRITLGRDEQPRSEADEVRSPLTVRGELTFWPDYPGADVPAWETSFRTSVGDCLRVRAVLQDGGLLDLPTPTGENGVGGETVTIDLVADGASWRIRSIDLPPRQREFLAGEVMAAVRATVPSFVWEEMHTRRAAYWDDREVEG